MILADTVLKGTLKILNPALLITQYFAEFAFCQHGGSASGSLEVCNQSPGCK